MKCAFSEFYLNSLNRFRNSDGGIPEIFLKGIRPDEILENALVPAMAKVGNKFSRKETYLPQMLILQKL